MSALIENTNRFSERELDSIESIKKSLLEQSIDVSERELILCTMNCKLDTQKATEKYIKWLESIKLFGFNSFSDIWTDLDYNVLAKQFKSYAMCGLDSEGRSVMWIKGYLYICISCKYKLHLITLYYRR